MSSISSGKVRTVGAGDFEVLLMKFGHAFVVHERDGKLGEWVTGLIRRPCECCFGELGNDVCRGRREIESWRDFAARSRRGFFHRDSILSIGSCGSCRR